MWKSGWGRGVGRWFPQPQLLLPNWTLYCVKVSKYGVFSGLDFPMFGLNTEIYVNLRIQSVYRKIRTRENSVFGHFSNNIDTFNLVLIKTHKWTRNDFTNVFIHIPCNKVWEYQNELSKIRNKSTVNSRTHG